MSYTFLRKLLLLLTAFSLAVLPLGAQTVKTIAVSNDASYTDHISLAEDSRDMDIMVKFIFDEGQNTLTVSVISYRSLFVFREATRYSSVVKACGRLKPDLLPYVAESDEKDRFLLDKNLVKSIPRPRKIYIFRRWIEYEGLQLVPSEYKMVNDYIEQSFDILQKRNSVTVTLRDLFLLEQSPKKAGLYRLIKGRDLNTKYQIQVFRNPCLGMEEEVVVAQKRLADIRTAWQTMKKNFGGGEVASREALDIFEKTRTMLLTQFPPRQEQSACSDVQRAIDGYNNYVDSIANLSCRIRVSAPDEVPGQYMGLDVQMVYSQARQLDKNVARFLVSKDALEKSDLVEQCKDIISDVNARIQRRSAVNSEERKAVAVFRQAEQYFRRVCKQ